MRHLSLGYDTATAQATPTILAPLTKYAAEIQAISAGTDIKTKNVTGKTFLPTEVPGVVDAIVEAVERLRDAVNDLMWRWLDVQPGSRPYTHNVSWPPEADLPEEPSIEAHRFFRVGRLIPEDQDVVTISPSTSVRDALDLMTRWDFDQLPVTVGSRVVGVFTYRSLARGLKFIRRQDDPLDQPVEDLCEELCFVRASDELNIVLEHLEADGAVLVGDEDRILAVATSTDITSFLWNTTRPFVLLQDIELAIRDLMRSACSADELQKAILVAERDGASVKLSRLEDLSLGQLLNVLLSDANFGGVFRRSFGRNREIVRSILEPVRDVRNKVFHFRDDVTPEELQMLVSAVTWLRRKVIIRDGGAA